MMKRKGRQTRADLLVEIDTLRTRIEMLNAVKERRVEVVPEEVRAAAVKAFDAAVIVSKALDVVGNALTIICRESEFETKVVVANGMTIKDKRVRSKTERTRR